MTYRLIFTPDIKEVFTKVQEGHDAADTENQEKSDMPPTIEAHCITVKYRHQL